MSNDIPNLFYNNLDELSKIKNGDKLYIENNCIKIDEPYMFQGIWRYCNNVSRKDAILVINKLLNDIELFFNSLLLKNITKSSIQFTATSNNVNSRIKIKQDEYNILYTINTKLKLSIPGIENLKKTYETDNEISGETDKIISKINNLVNNINNIINQ
jgi:hypothetical protein